MSAKDLYSVYERCFPSLPASREQLCISLSLTSGKQKILMEYSNGEPIAACVYNDIGVLLLAVIPGYQDKGLGTKLLTKAEIDLFGSGKEVIRLGDAGGYLWPGVPWLDTNRSTDFFAKRGYASDWMSLDLILPLKDYTAPRLVPCNSDISVQRWSTYRMDELLRCVEQVEERWTEIYRVFSPHDILVATHLDACIGFVMLLESGIRTEACFDGKVGGLGCLGVLPSYRNQGVGLHLARAATLELMKMGLDYAHVGYTWLEDWYGKLGYRRHIAYWMGEKRRDI